MGDFGFGESSTGIQQYNAPISLDPRRQINTKPPGVLVRAGAGIRRNGCSYHHRRQDGSCQACAPATFDASVIIAAVAAVSAAGTVVIRKKS